MCDLTACSRMCAYNKFELIANEIETTVMPGVSKTHFNGILGLEYSIDMIL